MRGAALQIHTVDGRGSARAALEALPPSLALYAALALVLGGLFAAPFDTLAFVLGAGVAAAGALTPERPGRAVRLAAALGAALAFALSPTARQGAMLLANRLYAASEAVNAYAYEYYEVSGAGEAGAIRAALLAAAVPGGALCAIAPRRRAVVVALFLGVVFVEAYFGVTPEAWRNVLLFAVLAPLLVRGETNVRDGAALLAGFAALTLAVLLLAPRPIAAVEAYSERLRDELDVLATNAARTVLPPEEETNRARQESRQHEEAANADASQEQNRQEFDRETEYEREISLPHRIDYTRIALLLLAVVALLLAPFAPFLLLSRAKRRAAERRAAFEDADNAAAIRAMFAHTMDWLRESGLQTENRPFAACGEAVEALTSGEYAAQYAEAVLIWQEAAYSEHAMDAEKRAVIRALMEKTEAALYGKADRRTRFRLKYVNCLCEV